MPGPVKIQADILPVELSTRPDQAQLTRFSFECGAAASYPQVLVIDQSLACKLGQNLRDVI